MSILSTKKSTESFNDMLDFMLGLNPETLPKVSGQLFVFEPHVLFLPHGVGEETEVVHTTTHYDFFVEVGGGETLF